MFRTNKWGDTKTPTTEESRFSRNFIPLFNRLITNILAPEQQHLTEVDVDLEARIEAFWSLGGFEPDKMLKKIRENNKKMRFRKVDDPIDR